jgi:hypothetical protein
MLVIRRAWILLALAAFSLAGLSCSDSSAIPTLHGGQTVEVSEAKVFDYIYRYADGSEEGNETRKLIEKRSR